MADENNVEETTLSRDDILEMQAIERRKKLSKPRIKDSVLLATIVEFLNSDARNVNLTATYPTIAEPKVRNLLKAHAKIGEKCWPLMVDNDGLYLVRTTSA